MKACCIQCMIGKPSARSGLCSFIEPNCCSGTLFPRDYWKGSRLKSSLNKWYCTDRSVQMFFLSASKKLLKSHKWDSRLHWVTCFSARTELYCICMDYSAVKTSSHGSLKPWMFVNLRKINQGLSSFWKDVGHWSCFNLCPELCGFTNKLYHTNASYNSWEITDILIKS